MGRLFHSSGKFCASHPWEVIVAFLTLSICLMSVTPVVQSSACALVSCPAKASTAAFLLLLTPPSLCPVYRRSRTAMPS